MFGVAGILVGFVGTLIASVLAAMALSERRWVEVAWWVGLALLCAYLLTRIPAPEASAVVVEEPTVWPTETVWPTATFWPTETVWPTATSWPTETAWPASGCKDMLDAHQTELDMHEYRLGVVETREAGWGAAPSAAPVATVVATWTATATPASKLCHTCVLATDCDLNMACYQCGADKRWRCVWTVLRNGTCTQCINAGQ